MIKKILKWFLLILLVLLLVGCSFSAHEWYAKKPFFFNNFLNRELVKVGIKSPELLTQLGFLESLGIKGHNRDLDDGSLAAEDELYDIMKTAAVNIENYADDDLSGAQLLSKEIATYLLNQGAAEEKFRFHSYPVNQLFGLQNGYPSFMESAHQVNTVEDAENYILRLQKVGTKFAQNMEGLVKREELGIVPPKFVIERVLEEMRGFIAEPIEENILYASLQKKITEAEEIDDEQGADLLSRAKAEVAASVHPAYQGLIDYFARLELVATTDDGYWKLPDGAAAYRVALESYTTTSYTADEIHQIGLSEVERIQSEILTILSAEGYNTTKGFTAAIAELAAKPEFYYEDSDAGRAQILEDYQSILDEIDAGMDQVFSMRPKAGIEVIRIPEFKEKTSPGAYYEFPAIDGSRPGRFYANLYDIKATPKYGMRTLAYHEGVPGHHFQIAANMELKGLPLFRKIPIFTAYTEGWALYTEQLAWEMGYQSDPFDNIGRLQAELFRGVRLVVDTGIHAKRWTREAAIQYMLDNTGMPESDVTSEIERYIVMPGQATAYKVGMMKILEVREKAKLALGEKFNLRDFHDVVLRNGAVPLDLLERLVDQYIQENTT